MYYPKQIPYLLDQQFKKHVEYLEYHIKELEDISMCIWTMKSKKKLNDTLFNQILPDACIDLVIDFIHQTIHFAGFSTYTKPFLLHNNIDYIGIRLKPGIFYSLFHINANQIMDHEIPFNEIEKNINLNYIFHFKTKKERINCIKQYFIQKKNNKPKTMFLDLVEELYLNPKEQNVIKLAQKWGYHERHLYRLFKINYGVSPKVLFNILRLHLCLTLLLENKKNLVEITHLCGFYDQSHFIKEIKKYTGISPIQILESNK